MTLLFSFYSSLKYYKFNQLFPDCKIVSQSLYVHKILYAA